MSIELQGRKKGGRPQRSFLDVVKEDMKTVGVREQDARDRVRWRQMMESTHTHTHTYHNFSPYPYWVST